MKLNTTAWNNRCRAFRSKEEGGISVAAVLWVPFFVFLMTVVFDVSMIFYGQARAHEVAENVNRSLSVGRISTYDEAETLARTSLSSISPNARANTTSNDFVIRTVIKLPTSDLAGVGFIPSLRNFEITAVAHMVQEF